MREVMPNEILEWLQALPHISNLTPCSVQIGKSVYPACEYVATHKTIEGCRAYQEGEREYQSRMIYVVGNLPAYDRNGAKVCYRLPNDSRDWYVASYFPEAKRHRQAEVEPNEYHPFGASFQLAPWSVPSGETIDHYENKPRQRVLVKRKDWAA